MGKIVYLGLSWKFCLNHFNVSLLQLIIEKVPCRSIRPRTVSGMMCFRLRRVIRCPPKKVPVSHKKVLLCYIQLSILLCYIQISVSFLDDRYALMNVILFVMIMTDAYNIPNQTNNAISKLVRTIQKWWKGKNHLVVMGQGNIFCDSYIHTSLVFDAYIQMRPETPLTRIKWKKGFQ